MNLNNSKTKRTFSIIRIDLLSELSKSQRTINQIATNTGINWRTVELHLTYLVGKGYAKEVFSSQYVRIFTITETGKNVLAAELNKIRDELVIQTEKELKTEIK